MIEGIKSDVAEFRGLDVYNSFTTPLTANETRRGEWRIDSQPDLGISFKASHAASITIYFSNDGVRELPLPAIKVAANTHYPDAFLKGGRFYRIDVTDTSGENHTYSDLYVYTGDYRQLNSPAHFSVGQYAGAVLTKNIDFNLLMAQGKFSGYKVINKEGINVDIDTGSVPEDIWGAGCVYTGFPIAEAAATVVSTSASDTGTLSYSYLETPTSTAYVFGSVTLNGTTPVSLGHSVWRCNYMVYDHGDDTSFNAGVISLYHTATPSNIFCTIQVGQSQTFCAAYTVPYQSTAVIDWKAATVRGSTSGSIDTFLWWRPFGKSPYLRFSASVSFGARYFDPVDYLVVIPGRTDIMPRCTFASANNLNIQYEYRLLESID
jgi:hypothetical protein